jgi:hypothetical protein
MKRILLILVLVAVLAGVVWAQGSAILPYISIFIRTLLNDETQGTAQTTLGLGTGDSPGFVNVLHTGYGQYSEIATPATPDPNILRVYAKDDGAGTSRFYILDDAGLETDLTGGGGGATTLDALLDVTLSGTPYTDGKVLRANGSDYVDAVLAHSDLSGVGSNAHTVIDTHLASTANPHSVTAAQAGAVALTGNETVAGIKTFSSFPILPSSSPTTAYQAVHKAYVDAFAQSLEVKLACRIATTAAATLATDFENGDTIDGVELATGNRILIKDQADATTNGIYTVNASGAPTRATDYDASAEVQEGTYTFITEGTANDGYQFVQITLNPVLNTNDLVYTYLTNSGTYTASLGVELSGADIRADLLAAGAIGLTGNELEVNVDGSSIEIATNALQVKALGVTNAMLAGSIADSKLDTISTADKVDWIAVNKTGSVLDDIADVNAPTPSDDQALAWDAATSQWMAQTVTGGGGAVNAAVSDVDVYSSGTVDAAWTNMPAAVTELFGSTSSRLKLDLTYGTHYRIVVNQTLAGYSTADFNLQYSTDNVTYQAADTAAAGECAVGAGTGVKVGSWAELVAGANADVWLRIVGKQGDGKVDPRWRQIRIQFKMLSTGGEAPANAQYVVLAANGTLSAEQVLAVSDTTTMNLTLSTATISADGLYTAGDHLTLTDADFDVDDDFLLNNGDSGTGVYDFGGATTFEIANTAGDVTLGVAGQIAVDSTNKQLVVYDGVEKSVPLVHSMQFHGDLAGAWDVDAEWQLLDMDRGASVFPNGIVITSWYVDCSKADPTTELNANLYYCDALGNGAFPGANPVLVDVLDTTTGNANETNMANSDLTSGVIPTAHILYVLIDADPTDTLTVWSVIVNYYIPES